jgi:hypothetical protein
MSAVRKFCTAILFSLFWVPALSAAQGADSAMVRVQPLGEFAKVRTTEDHAYGHRARLWRSGSQLIGEIMYWDASIEGQSGRFINGVYDQRTGAVTFKTVVIRHDVQPNTRSAVSFEGFLNKGALSGKVTWAGDIAKFRGKNGVEDVVLPLNKGERLASFATLEALQKANAY